MNELRSGSTLKLIGLTAMTADHIGFVFFPEVMWLRVIGRLAWPVFAYMVAEGCHYTKHKDRYLGMMAGLAFVCAAADYIVEKSMYQSVLVTFTFAIVIIYALQGLAENLRKDISSEMAGAGNGNALPKAEFLSCGAGSIRAVSPLSGATWVYGGLSGVLLAAAFVFGNAPLFFPETEFRIDYGFFGILTTVLVWAGRNRTEKLFLFAAGLVLTAVPMGGVQYASLFVLPLLFLYNGKRGKYSLKYFFYLYYPVHLAVIYGIFLICS